MRICFVSRELASTTESGVGTAVANMSRALVQAGHDVHVLTAPHVDARWAASVHPSVHIHHVDEQETDLQGAFPHAELRHAWDAYRALRVLHASHQFDIIEFPDSGGEGHFALRARRTLGQFDTAVLAVRLYHSSHDVLRLNQVATLDMDTAQREHMEDTALREADLLVSPSAVALEQTRTRLGLKTGGIVLPPPIESAPAQAATPSPSEAAPRVLYAGRLEYREGVHLLIDAMQALFEQGVAAEVDLVGDDTRTGPFGRSLRSWLEQRIAPAWRHRFQFLPARAGDELTSAFAHATLCCIPTRWDALHGTGVAAMSAGAAVVASDSGGMAEFIEDGRSGLLFHHDDAGHLKDVLQRALASTSLRDTLRAAAPARVASLCAPARFVRDYEAAATSALPHRHPGPAPSSRTKPAKASPCVSILVPYFNMGRYLPETLHSIRAQTFTDYEIILVDDGSTDADSVALLETLQAPDLRIIRKANGGLSSARNAGLRVARGPYVLPLDPDDLIQPTFLEKAVAVMESAPGLGYVTSLVSYFVDDPRQPVGGWIPWGTERDALLAENVASTCTALMQRTHLEDIGGYDEWLTAYEDWDVFCSLAKRGLEGSVIPEPLFLYRQRPDSMTRGIDVSGRYAQMAYLSQKHPTLPRSPDRALRMQLGRAQRQETHLRAAAPPLMSQVANRVNSTLKRFDAVHGTVRRAVAWAAGAEDDSRPLRQQVLERLLGRRR
ncbi:Beta-1,3-glucosyltransferase [Myxococcus hansupus]|uniref:Beta-1,3-glucosyltransferase n=1 Tax=Pseudomyxococcus hansupus TaxID=1297742 RepID=A0A0H4WRF5_9BACT|nr:glycosyltransferase [Myxococcus hansupus]AKQ65369.1 Beta-1,3-glucosyltransferase [Myxococcus hansupus]